MGTSRGVDLSDEREDFINKLITIEREAELLARSLPSEGAMLARAMHISTTAKLLKARLEVAASLILDTPSELRKRPS